MSDLEALRQNLDGVRERVARAAERAGRRAEDVLLIGVSKTVPLERRAATRGHVVEALLEINVADEPSKSGFTPDALDAALQTIGGLTHVRVRGLMAIPPIVERAEDARPSFQTLRRFA